LTVTVEECKPDRGDGLLWKGQVSSPGQQPDRIERDPMSFRTAGHMVRLSRVAVAAFGVTAVMLLLPSGSLATPTVRGSGGKIGRFTFGGALTGKLKTYRRWTVPPGGLVVAGCQITTTPTDADLNFFDARLKLKHHLVTVNGGNYGIAAELDIQVSTDGNTESLAGLNAPAIVTFNAFIQGKAYAWQSNTTPTSMFEGGGTLTTNARNTAGSVDATLIPVTPAARHLHKTLTVKGSWSHCAPFVG
jgi:hypothetical protein